MDLEAIKLLQEIKAIVTTISNDSAPWIAFSGVVLAAIFAGYFSISAYQKSQKDVRRQHVLDQRKQALFEALQAINHVYANTVWNEQPPLNPAEWDINLARAALNKLNVYCERPDAVIKAFHRAVGTNDVLYNAASINDFIRECARELDLPEVSFTDENKAWISSLPGTRECEELEKRRAFKQSF